MTTTPKKQVLRNTRSDKKQVLRNTRINVLAWLVYFGLVVSPLLQAYVAVKDSPTVQRVALAKS